MSATRSRRLRVSIRYKFLIATVTLVLAASGVYLWLGNTLIVNDRLVYTYDLNSALVDTLSAEVGSRLQLLAERSQDFAAAVLSEADVVAREQLFDVFLARHPELIRVELLGEEGGEWRRLLERSNSAALEELGLNPESYEELRPERPLPLGELARLGLLLHNVSIPPDAVILTMAAPASTYGGDSAHAAAVVIDFKPAHLLRILAQPGPYTSYLVDREGHVLVHPNVEHVIEGVDLKSRPLVREALESPASKLVKEYPAEGEVWLGAFAKIEGTGTAVLTEMPKAEALRAARELTRRTIFASIGILLAALIISVLFSRVITRSIRQLAAATEAVARGDLDVELEVNSSDEIGELAERFRTMTQALRQTQAQLVQSEKMAAFGQLGAGITHEVKNPLTGILGFAQLGQRAKDPEQLQEMMAKIEKSARSCKEIVDRFLIFARSDTEKLELIDLNQLTRDGLELVAYELRKGKIKVELSLGERLPSIKVNRGSLQQVLLNLFLNAQQAMPDGGTLDVSTALGADDGVLLSVRDSGPGVPAELRERIFEPFFTTEPSGGSTGLGLAISYGILRDHGGSISVESEPGQGATFKLWLPSAPVIGVSAKAQEALRQRQDAKD